MEIVGHGLGFIAVGLYFLSYQIYEKRKLLLVQTAATTLNCLQYLLIGAYSGFALNIVCVCRNFAFYYRDKEGRRGALLPSILALIIVLVSLFSWDGLHSLLIVLGLAINTVCMGVFNSQNLRKSVLLTCALIFTYNVFAGSYSGMVSESISWLSALIGIIRYRNNKD